MDAPAVGLLVLYVCVGTAFVVIAAAVHSLVSRFNADAALWVELKARELACREREAENGRQALMLRDRELRIEEADAADERDDDGPGF